jgi:hypothetical protein
MSGRAYAAQFFGVAIVYAALLAALRMLFRGGGPRAGDRSRAGGATTAPEIVARRRSLPSPRAVELPLAEFDLGHAHFHTREPQEPQQEPDATTPGLARLADGLVAALESPGIRRPKLREMLTMASASIGGRPGRTRKARGHEGREVDELRQAYGERRDLPAESFLQAQVSPQVWAADQVSQGSPRPEKVDLSEALPITITSGRAEVPTKFLAAPMDAVFGAQQTEASERDATQPADGPAESAEDRIMRLHIRGSGML